MREGTVMSLYLREVFGIVQNIHDHEKEHILAAVYVMAEQIRKDRLIYILGPGGYSNLAAMEIFFRIGGPMYVSAMPNRNAMLSCGALKPMQTEHLSGFSRIIINDYRIGEGDPPIVVNAHGINSATIDAVLQAKENGATIIGASSYEYAENCPREHPTRYPSKENLHGVADYAMDCKARLGDVITGPPSFEQKVGALSTFANVYVLNSMVIETTNILNNEGVKPPVWTGGNASDGGKWNNRSMQGFRDKIRCLQCIQRKGSQ